MQIGDPKKAAVLGIVALVIVTVAAFRLAPHGPKPLPTEVARAAGAQATNVQVQAAAALPSTLTSEPFEKPHSEVIPDPAKAQQTRATPRSEVQHPLSVEPPDGAAHAPFVLETLPDGTARPSENTGIRRIDNKEGPLTITLTGIVSVTRRIAIVTASNEPDKPMNCELGSKVDGYTVTAIGETSMALKKGKKSFELSVGTSKSL